MSGEKPKDQDTPDDLAAIGGAFSPDKGRTALDDEIRKHAGFFGFLWRARFWWIAASAFTFILPVLRNDNVYALSYSQTAHLYGFDLLIPMLSATNVNNSGYVYNSYISFSINPLALVIYGLLALQLYLFFVKTPVSPRLSCWHGGIQTILTVLFPFLDIPVLNIVLPKFSSHWHIQPPLFGFWVLLLCGLALWSGAYSQLLKGGSAHVPPPISR